MKDILKLNDKYNKVFFDWIKEDVFICINELEVLIEKFSITNYSANTIIDEAISKINQISGAFYIIELYSLYNLSIHLEELIVRLNSEDRIVKLGLKKTIFKSTKDLKIFINNFYIHNEEVLKKITYSIDATRDILGIPSISLVNNTDNKKQNNSFSFINIQQLKENELEEIIYKDFASQIQQINQTAQLAILAITNKIDVYKNIQRLNQALSKILFFTDKSPLSILFKNLQNLLYNINEDDINKQNLRFYEILQKVGKEIQELNLRGIKYFNHIPDDECLKIMKNLDEENNKNQNQANNQIIPNNNSLIDNDLSNNVFLNIKQILNILKKQLEQFVNSNKVDFTSLKASKENLIKVAETLKILNYISLKKILDKNILQIKDILDKRETPNQQSLMSLAGSILYIEDIIIGTIKKQNIGIKSNNSTKEIQTESYVESITQECIVNLEQFQEEIVTFIYSNWDKRSFKEYEKLLHTTSGALFFLNMKDMVKIPDTIKFFTKNKLMRNNESPTWDEIDHLADSLSGFQYYLKNITNNSDEYFLKDIYNKIIDNLSKLNIEIIERNNFTSTNNNANTNISTNQVIHKIEDISNTKVYDNYTDTIKIKERNSEIQKNLNNENKNQDDIDTTKILIENLKPKKLLPPESIDTDKELIEIFTEEAKEVLETINTNMPIWEKDLSNLEALKEIRRAFHTLKGSGRMVQGLVIGELAWAIESLLNKVLSNNIEPSEEVAQIINDSTKAIPNLIEEFANNKQTHKDEVDILAHRAEIISKNESWNDILNNINFSQEKKEILKNNNVVINEIDDHLVRVFIEEANENIGKISKELNLWKDNNKIDHLIELKCIFHTMQSSGEMVQASVISLLSWSVEDLLNKLIDNVITKSSDVYLFLIEVNDIMPTLLNDLILKQKTHREEVDLLIKKLKKIENNNINNLIQKDIILNKNRINREINNNIDDELLEIYFNEIDEHLKSFYEFIEISRENLPQFITDELQRTIHTMKGSSYMVHFNEVAEICAPLEILLKDLKLNNLEIGFTELQILENVYIQVFTFIDSFKNSKVIEIANEDIIQEINNLIDAIDSNTHYASNSKNKQKSNIAILLNTCMDTISNHELLLKKAKKTNTFESSDLENIILNLNRLHEISSSFKFQPFDKLSMKLIQIYQNYLEYDLQLNVHDIKKLDEIQENVMNSADQLAAGLTVRSYDTEQILLLDEILENQSEKIQKLKIIKKKQFNNSISKDNKNNEIIDDIVDNFNEELDINFTEDLDDYEDFFNQFNENDIDQKSSIDSIFDNLDLDKDIALNDNFDDFIDSENANKYQYKDSELEDIEDKDINDILNSINFENNNNFNNNKEQNSKALEIEFLKGENVNNTKQNQQITITSETLSFTNEIKNSTIEDQIDEDILEVFLEEASDVLDQANISLEKWLQSPDENQDEIQLLQRHLHTLKGGARMVGINSLGTLTHELETLYEKFVEGELDYNENLNQILQESHDDIAVILEALQKREKLPNVKNSIRKVVAFLNKDISDETKNIKIQNIKEQDDNNNQQKDFIRSSFLTKESKKYRDLKDSNKFINSTTKNDVLSYTSNLNLNEDVQKNIDVIDYDILDIFLEEAPDTLEEANKALDVFLKDRGNIKALDELNRYLHTLQAGAKMTGISSLGNLSYELEIIYEALAINNAKFNPNLGKFLKLAHDKISHTLKSLKHRKPIPKLTIFIKTLEYYKQHGILPQNIFQKTLNKDDIESLSETKIIDFNEAKTLKALTANDLPFVIATRKKIEEVKKEQKNTYEQIRVSSDILSNLIDLAGETSIFSGRVEQKVLGLSSYISEMDMTIERALDQLRRLDIETQAQISSRMTEIEQSGYEDFDPLEMDRHSQLQQLSRALFESASDLNDLKNGLLSGVRDTQTLLLQQSRVNTELQENLMGTRLVSFEKQLPRVKRIVRQAAKELNKEIDFVIENTQGEMDRSVLDALMTPLEHMLRNAVDHGIEDKEKRLKSGKPEKGTIRLNLSKDGSDILLTLSDDGAGIRIERVRKKAIEKGLIDPNDKMTDHEIAQLILSAGLSTAEKITQISGRGVGMDVATSEVQKLGGSIVVHSKKDQGTTFVVRIPFTVSINKSLMVEIGSDLYAIPLTLIDNILQVPTEQMSALYKDKESKIQYLKHEYQVYYLGDFLNKNDKPKLIENQKASLILIKSSDVSAAIQVDNIIGSQEIVVKTLGGYFSHIRGVSGVTLLGDGRVVVILDLPTMVRSYEKIYLEHQSQGITNTSIKEVQEKDKPLLVMITDDSVTVRKVTSRLLERNDMQVITAKDGLDAISKLQEGIRPDIMLLDIEMPNMDGFEAATNIRHGSFYPDLPIIMITSRSGDKHKNRAFSIGINEYMSKPYQEEALLNNIYKLTGRDK